MVLVDEGGEGIGRVSVQEDVQLHQPRRAEVGDMVIEGSIALGDGLELVIKVEDHLGQRQVVVQLHAVRSDVMLADQRAPLVHAQFHDGAVKIGLGDNLGADVRFLDMVYDGGRRQTGRVVHVHHFALGGIYLIRYVGDGGDYVHVELPEQALLYNLQVQQAQEAAAEAEAQGQGALRLIGEGSVVELKLLQRGPQLLELGGVHRIEAGEDHRLHFLEARNRLATRVLHMGDGVAHLHFHGGLDAGDDIPHVSGLHLAGGVQLEFQVAHLLGLVLVAGREELHLVSAFEAAVHHLEVSDDAPELVEDGVEDESLQRRVRVSLRGGNLVHDGVQHRLHTFSRPGRYP